jgi:ABC-type nitrate/sulfonate/bicarbonate transport system ATPase subunit
MTSSFLYQKKETLLDIQNVSVSYDGTPVLKNLSATIANITRPGMQQGQIVGLLGPSGIGKTTLFRVLAGIIRPDSGSVRIGAEGNEASPGDVGVVAQNYPLLSHRSVLGNLVFAAQQAGLSKTDATAAAKNFLVEFKLEDHAPKYPAQLSGGQRQRVAIAQQLICSKHFVIMDEPFSGLDVVALSKVRNQIQQAAQKLEENTFIVVTHDVTSAVSIADTIWLMGRDRDAQGNIIPGARIMDTIDLIERDIAWHEDPTSQPQAVTLIREIKQRFLTL